MLEQIKVSSSAIESVGYDDETGALYVTFKRGAEYIYPQVSRKEFEGLVSAPSVGRYFNEHIKQYSANQ